jgi:CBS domain-containing protein
MKISVILKEKGGHVHSIAPDATLAEALDKMLEFTIGSLIVLDTEGKLVGILSERDMLRSVDKSEQAWSAVHVCDSMTRDVVTAQIDNKVEFAKDLMTNHRIRHLPILTEGDKLAGVLSIGDIIKAQLTETAFQNQLLKNYIKNWPEQG